MAGTRSWREVRGERALNEARIEEFRRLMDAQRRIVEALTAHGVSEAQVQVALTAAELALPRDERAGQGFCTEALTRFVTALGGKLDSGAAVFPQARVPLPKGPDEGGA